MAVRTLLQRLFQERLSIQQVPPNCDIERLGRTLELPRGRDQNAVRQYVLLQTLVELGTPAQREEYHQSAMANVKSWSANPGNVPTEKFHVACGDWGDVTLEFTRAYGKVFAVLNMANSYVAGGGYVEGMIAQEENMFRRTDCHFAVDEKEFDQRMDRYKPEVTDLINAKDGEVPLDTKQPRVCIRGSEDRQQPDLGYRWLSKDTVFPFYELRSAAMDLRDGSRFSRTECKKRIEAQLNTLKKQGVRHAILSAFGCGAFLNPPEIVAQCYCDALKECEKDFDCIAFAIFYPGYGYDNFSVFKEVFEQNDMGKFTADA